VQLLLFDLIVPNDPSYAAVALPPILFPCSLLCGISSITCMVTMGRRTRKLHRGRRAATGKQIRIPSLFFWLGSLRPGSQHAQCRYLVTCTSRVRLERAGVWLLVRDKSHEIKNIKKFIIFILYKKSFRGLILSNHVLIIHKIHQTHAW
jgi:hypothetical protein